MIKDKKKLKINNLQERELRAYFFIRQAEPTQMKQGINVEFAYDLDQASEQVVKKVEVGWMVRDCGFLPVKKFFEQIELSGTILEPKKISKEQFILNLTLASEEFIKDTKERNKLKKILEKIKV